MWPHEYWHRRSMHKIKPCAMSSIGTSVITLATVVGVLVVFLLLVLLLAAAARSLLSNRTSRGEHE